MLMYLLSLLLPTVTCAPCRAPYPQRQASLPWAAADRAGDPQDSREGAHEQARQGHDMHTMLLYLTVYLCVYHRYIRTSIHPCMHPCMHAYKHAYVHT